MEELLTPEMKTLVTELGALVKADPRNESIKQAIEEYERCEELNAMIAEYNAQQNLLADAYAGTDDPGEEFKKAVQTRIDALYDSITSHPVYTAYLEAKSAFDALTNCIISELQFAITGQRTCSHDCASCGGCGGQKN